jgi:hypothetical protein
LRYSAFGSGTVLFIGHPYVARRDRFHDPAGVSAAATGRDDLGCSRRLRRLIGMRSHAYARMRWQLGGFAPTISLPSDFTQPKGLAGSTAQLVQAMASFGGGSGAGESLNTAALSTETSQQMFLTTPHA